MTPLFLRIGSLSLGAIRRLLTSFEIHLYAMFVTGLFEALTHTLMIGYHHVGLWALVVVVASVFALCSNINNNMKWFWHLPLLAITSAIIHNMMNKNIFPYTPWCIKICRENIFFRLEEAHSDERKLVSL